MANEITAREEVIPKLGEIFRQHGYAGTSLSEITNQTGLGKSSLYHFFPKGKTEMAEAVLLNIDTWFTQNVYIPLRNNKDPVSGIQSMFKEVKHYFNSGKRICLVGAFALDSTRDQFLHEVSSYFSEWVNSLAAALKNAGVDKSEAKSLSEDVVVGIQGSLVLARSVDDPKIFVRSLKRLQQRVVDTING